MYLFFVLVVYIDLEGIRVIYLPRGSGLYTSVRMRPQKPRLRHRSCGTIKIPSGSKVIDNDHFAGFTVTMTSIYECNFFYAKNKQPTNQSKELVWNMLMRLEYLLYL